MRPLVSSLGEAGRAGADRKTPATAENWIEFLGLLAGFLSMLFVWWLASGRVPRLAKADREAYELDADEAEAIATPAARLLARSFINRQWGHHILGAPDFIALGMALVSYGQRIEPLVEEKLYRQRAQTARPAQPPKEEPRVVERPAPVADNGRAYENWPVYPAAAT